MRRELACEAVTKSGLPARTRSPALQPHAPNFEGGRVAAQRLCRLDGNKNLRKWLRREEMGCEKCVWKVCGRSEKVFKLLPGKFVCQPGSEKGISVYTADLREWSKMFYEGTEEPVYEFAEGLLEI